MVTTPRYRQRVPKRGALATGLGTTQEPGNQMGDIIVNRNFSLQALALVASATLFTGVAKG